MTGSVSIHPAPTSAFSAKMSAEDEARRKLEKPRCSAADVVAFVRANFTLDGGDIDDSSVVELNSYDDRNYYVKTTDGSREYTLKVHNGVESRRPTLLAAQSAMMRHLDAAGVPVPVPVKTDAGKRLDAVGAELRGVDADDVAFLRLPLPEDCDEPHRDHAVRVLTWIPGEIAERSARVVHTPRFLRDVGGFLGDVAAALVSFHHPGAERRHLWDNANVLAVRDYAEAIEDPANRELAESVFRDFETKVMPHASTLRRGVCQNDANDQNVVVRVAEPSVAARYFSPGRRTVNPTAVPVGLSILAISCTRGVSTRSPSPWRTSPSAKTTPSGTRARCWRGSRRRFHSPTSRDDWCPRSSRRGWCAVARAARTARRWTRTTRRTFS